MEEPRMEEYQKAYIELVARKVADEFDKRLSEKISANEQRLRKVEQKLYNGINSKLKLLMAFYTASITGIIAIILRFILKG